MIVRGRSCVWHIQNREWSGDYRGRRRWPSAGSTGNLMTPSSLPEVTLSAIEDELVLARLDPAQGVPPDIFSQRATVISVTRTGNEISVVCPASLAPAEAKIDGPWCAWYVQGPIPFGFTGVIQAVVSPLSSRGIPVFVVSTFDSDVIMVPAHEKTKAEAAFARAGHTVYLSDDHPKDL